MSKTAIADKILASLTEFAEALESGKDLHGIVRICRVQIDPNSPAYIAAVVADARRQIKASLAKFGAFLGVSAKTVRAWERGTLTPDPTARRFIEEIRAAPKHYRKRLAEMSRPAKVGA